MTLPNRLYFTGVPGSRWSGIAQVLETIPGFNTTDRTPNRTYSHAAFSGHVGLYYGNGMEYPPILDIGAIDDPWSDLSGCRIIKSHDWAYNIKQVHQHAKQYGDWVMLVYRPDLTSYAWWHQAGGFEIKYPSYTWYENSSKMLREIQIQNQAILDYAFEVESPWAQFTPKWQTEHFGACAPNFTKQPSHSDILVTLLR